MGYFYISNPYNGTEAQKDERAKIAAEVCAKLLKQGIRKKGMIVLTIDGWKESYGVRAEIELCKELAIPVQYWDPTESHSTLRVN